MPLRRSTLPNVITLARTLVAPVVSILTFVPGFGSRLLAFILFTAAALSDLWDGYLARKHGWITPFGTLMDPIADKLLILATFLPFYLISHSPDPIGTLPYWGVLPLWVLAVVFGREILITVMRAFAARQGKVIAAERAGKQKAFAQNFFSGTTLLWYALRTAAEQRGWTGPVWEAWRAFHGVVLGVTLLAAIILTVYSMVVYLRVWRLRMSEAG